MSLYTPLDRSSPPSGIPKGLESICANLKTLFAFSLSKLLLGWMMCFISLSLYAIPASFSKIRVTHPESDRDRLIFEFSHLNTFHAVRLSHPDRLLVTLQKTKLKTLFPNVPVSDLIQKMDIKRWNTEDLRVVLYLNQVSTYQIIKLPAKKSYSERLVIDVLSSNSASQSSSLTPSVSQSEKVEKSETVQALPVKSDEESWKPNLRDVVVMIDPGHGGKDPGAIGPNNTQEKDVVLPIGKALRDYINKEPGFHAEMTRSGDEYLSLRERLKRAHDVKADLFIAVHADAINSDDAQGVSVYTLSERGASSEAARWLAEKENYSELGRVALDDKSDLLRSVLIDLSQTATIDASVQMGEGMLRSLDGLTALHRRHVEQARFVVLKSPDIPSVLVETGFISNDQEEEKLGDSQFQHQVAHSMMQGLKNYFLCHPPLGTKLAWLQRSKRYIVARGDNIFKVAQKYGVSARSIVDFNRMRGYELNVGQVLTMPPSG